jgi:hypothetical protein
MFRLPLRGSQPHYITGKVSVFPLKNSLSEVKEITVASPFSSMLVYFRDRGGRAVYRDGAWRALIENVGMRGDDTAGQVGG